MAIDYVSFLHNELQNVAGCDIITCRIVSTDTWAQLIREIHGSGLPKLSQRISVVHAVVSCLCRGDKWVVHFGLPRHKCLATSLGRERNMRPQTQLRKQISTWYRCVVTSSGIGRFSYDQRTFKHLMSNIKRLTVDVAMLSVRQLILPHGMWCHFQVTWNYSVSQKKGCHPIHGSNFVNSWSICKILSLL